MTRLRKIRSRQQCNCENNPTGVTSIQCRCGKFEPRCESDEDEPTTSPPPLKKSASEKQEEADGPETSKSVAVLGSALLNSQEDYQPFGSNGSISHSSKAPSCANFSGYPLNKNNADRDNIIIQNHKKSTLADLINTHLDVGTLVEIVESDPNDLILVGKGIIDRRRVVIYAHQLLSPGNPILKRQAEKIVEARRYALKIGIPMFGIERYNNVYNQHHKYLEFRDVMFSDKKDVPYFRLQVGAENVSLNTTDDMITADFLLLIGESNDENNKRTQRVFRNSTEAKEQMRDLLRLSPESSQQYPDEPYDVYPRCRDVSSVDKIMLNMIPCDVRYLLNWLVDYPEFFEFQPKNGGAIITGFAQIVGGVYAIIANNPNSNRPWNEETSYKADKLLNFCSKFKMRLICILDRHTILQEYKRNDEYMKRLSASYNKVKGPIVNVITRTASEREEDDMVSKMFISNKTLIWKTKKNLAFDKGPNCRPIPPMQTRHEVYHAFRGL